MKLKLTQTPDTLYARGHPYTDVHDSLVEVDHK